MVRRAAWNPRNPCLACKHRLIARWSCSKILSVLHGSMPTAKGPILFRSRMAEPYVAARSVLMTRGCEWQGSFCALQNSLWHPQRHARLTARNRRWRRRNRLPDSSSGCKLQAVSDVFLSQIGNTERVFLSLSSRLPAIAEQWQLEIRSPRTQGTRPICIGLHSSKVSSGIG